MNTYLQALGGRGESNKMLGGTGTKPVESDKSTPQKPSEAPRRTTEAPPATTKKSKNHWEDNDVTEDHPDLAEWNTSQAPSADLQGDRTR